MTAATLPRPTSAAVAQAAASLVRARDGLAHTLLLLAEQTCAGTLEQAREVLEPLLAALDGAERRQLADALTRAAYEAHGPWYPGCPDRDQSAAWLAALAVTAANRVLHVLRYDACVCTAVTR